MADQKTDEARATTRPLDLMQLRTFLAIHRAGSLTAAARLLGLSQPTVTAQLKALEQRLGRQLFERLPHGVAPTSVALELAAQIAEPLDRLASVAGPSDDVAAAEEPVHLAGPAELVAVRAMPALAPLVGRGVRLRVTHGLADDLLDGLRAGRFDLVLSAIRPRGRAVTAVPLMDEEFVLVAGPVWAARIGAVDPGDARLLDELPLLSYAEDLPILRRYWRHVFRRRLTAPAAVVVPDLRAVLAAAVAGAGISVLPRYLCEQELADGRLVPLLEPDDPPINTGFLAHRAGARVLPHVDLVRGELLRQARDW
ncbi:LysR family transcriptional regulator [Couchioplanes caeruleus]|uniref:LysR family transcriptional regulator n=2 Tax=Couchioplanes caeruleus TaxID=56438 RepID=A0A1K0FZN3_9ACTN|nr:LysR family transcriptional regulator [Couchioplanes caeruleus]OJF10530.1 LysR family transcriptional regulator [Couchioplanes caeruleus subsp. caeruleus]ROP28626.1 DNA-binding transcriptional LysR family regulator [Couchioplanes caeruleus]